jgi:hypothetical protein
MKPKVAYDHLRRVMVSRYLRSARWQLSYLRLPETASPLSAPKLSDNNTPHARHPAPRPKVFAQMHPSMYLLN